MEHGVMRPQAAVAAAAAGTSKRLIMRRSSSLSAHLGSTSGATAGSSTPRRLATDSAAAEPILMAAELSVFESRLPPDEAAAASGHGETSAAADARQ